MNIYYNSTFDDNNYLKIQSYVDNDLLPEWVLLIYNLLQENNLKFYIEKDKEVIINILDVPLELRDTVLSKTKEYGLIFNIHTIQKPIYKGHPLYTPPHKIKLIGFEDVGYGFCIREAYVDEDINNIKYTLERK